MRFSRALAVAFITIAVALMVYAAVKYAGLLQRGIGVEQSGTALVGGPFALIDQNGQTVTDADFRGRIMLVYFGYAYCPDVCPTELAKMAAALDLLGPDAGKVAPIFITVDPERDTPAKLKDYVAQFHPQMVGLTGSVEQVTKTARAYRVYFAKSGDTGGANYLMDHTSFIYLMDQQGRYRKVFTPDAAPETIAAGIRQLL
ncbi:MAG TPA: SCO family protein [Candidatus Cybelea sp.]|nr:SCO family protein [Candidatus Cybelea sp.]